MPMWPLGGLEFPSAYQPCFNPSFYAGTWGDLRARLMVVTLADWESVMIDSMWWFSCASRARAIASLSPSPTVASWGG